MKCPVCHVELRMTERQGVEIDYCPQCRGVWLDRGELDKIIDRSADVDYRVPDDEPERYSDRDRGEHKHHKPRKKSFWREMFEFD